MCVCVCVCMYVCMYVWVCVCVFVMICVCVYCVCVCVCVCVCECAVKKTERERERDRDRETERDRERQRERALCQTLLYSHPPTQILEERTFVSVATLEAAFSPLRRSCEDRSSSLKLYHKALDTVARTIVTPRGALFVTLKPQFWPGEELLTTVLIYLSLFGLVHFPTLNEVVDTRLVSSIDHFSSFFPLHF